MIARISSPGSCVFGLVPFRIFLVALGWLWPAVLLAGLQPADLRCEFARNPLGVDLAHPRLFWKLASDARGDRQTAYAILAASSADLLAHGRGDLWSSGRIKSAETLQIPYAGKPLKSGQQVF